MTRPFMAAAVAMMAGATSGGGGGGGLLDGLVHWYDLGEGSGTRVDSVGSCPLSEAGSAASSVSTPAGTGVRIPSGAYLFGISGVADLSDSDFTVAGFFSGAGSSTGIFSRCISISDRQIWILTEAGSFLFVVSTTGNSNTATASISSVNPASPHFYFAWRDRAANAINLQIDGGAPVSVSFSGAASLYEPPGLRQMLGTLTDSGVYSGGADECGVGVWNRVLTADERDELYNGGAWKRYADL